MRIDDVQTAGERDVSKLIVSFRNCMNAPKTDDFFEAEKYDVDSKII